MFYSREMSNISATLKDITVIKSLLEGKSKEGARGRQVGRWHEMGNGSLSVCIMTRDGQQ